MLRIVGITVALAATCALTVGCGGAKTSPAAKTASGGAGGSITRPRAIAYAHAVNLQAGDVPELMSVSLEAETKLKPSRVEGARCKGAVSPYLRVVHVHSARFRGATASPQESVRSEVTVWPTSAIAGRDSAAALSPRGRACAQHLLERVAIAQTRAIHFSHVAITWMAPPLRGVPGSYAARVSLTLSGEPGRARPGPSTAVLESTSPSPRQVTIPVYFDALGFLVGPAEISLTATSVKRPASSATEHRLLSLLYRRAQAHKL